VCTTKIWLIDNFNITHKQKGHNIATHRTYKYTSWVYRTYRYTSDAPIKVVVGRCFGKKQVKGWRKKISIGHGHSLEKNKPISREGIA
jgi:hypothetical protein